MRVKCTVSDARSPFPWDTSLSLVSALKPGRCTETFQVPFMLARNTRVKDVREVTCPWASDGPLRSFAASGLMPTS